MGDNTDYFGFKVLVESLGIELAGKRAVVFGGHGGAGSTCMTVLGDLGMEPVAVCRAREEASARATAWPSVTYDELDRVRDAALAVNCTPVGMFPRCLRRPCSLDAFPALEALVDIVYNPARTALMMEAERRQIPCAGGLLMLVAQAAAAVERYTGEHIGAERIAEVTRALDAHEESIALIGMPGSGKTRVGAELARGLGREHVDIDRLLEEEFGQSCHAFITGHGEEAFRAAETACLERVAGRSGLVISCGGGVVTREANYPLLHQNSASSCSTGAWRALVPRAAHHAARRRGEARRRAHGALPPWADEIVASRESAAATARWIIDNHPLLARTEA